MVNCGQRKVREIHGRPMLIANLVSKFTSRYSIVSDITKRYSPLGSAPLPSSSVSLYLQMSLHNLIFSLKPKQSSSSSPPHPLDIIKFNVAPVTTTAAYPQSLLPMSGQCVCGYKTA